MTETTQTTAPAGTGPYGNKFVRILLAGILALAFGFTLAALISAFRDSEAERGALAQEPGKILYKVVEAEDGHLLYSFHIRTDHGIHEVNVNLFTGKIVEDSVEDVMEDEGIILWRSSQSHSP